MYPRTPTMQWPSTLNMAASFDPELAGEWGYAMGDEFWSKGTNIQEGPGINIARIENNGRTFEYLSGEDPVLGGYALLRRCIATFRTMVLFILVIEGY